MEHFSAKLRPAHRTTRSSRFILLALVAVCGVTLASSARTLSIVAKPDLAAPAKHGLEKIEAAARAKGWTVETNASTKNAHGDAIVIATLADSLTSVPSAPVLGLNVPEALAVKAFSLGGKPAVLFAGADARGLMYALLDGAQRIADAKDPANLFSAIADIEEQPTIRDRALSVYTMNRAYWESRFYNEDYWARYFDTLADNRFNRFLIIFGYENGGFLAPPYPYFFDTPGFPGVRMVGITPEQQRQNLAALNRLIELAHARGINVTLGIWDHIYRAGVQAGAATWISEFKGRSIPNSVEGVTTENLNAYTLASLRQLLARVPAVDSLHFRVHEESGLKRSEMEGFWKAVFEDVRATKPGMVIELRGKGTPDVVIDTARDNGLAVRVETKYWMEQMGLPFHPMHVNPQDQRNRRHGYADFLRYPQRYQMTWRLWNGGTSRVLLWGDPEYVRRYGATTALYDSPNWDVQEPLATKMEVQHPDMKPFDLMPEKYRYYDYEFERYWYFFQLWGRLGYNPETSSEVWDREFRRRFGPAAKDIEDGLHRASQVLPMIVASVYPYNNFPTTRGWAERQSLGASLAAYAHNEGTDVELFENFEAAADRILTNGATAKVTPEATSRWFDATADAVLVAVKAAEAAERFDSPSMDLIDGGGAITRPTPDAITQSLDTTNSILARAKMANIAAKETIIDKHRKEFDSTVTDLRILAQLARFHARRSLAAVHYNLYQRSQRKAELLAAVSGEKEAVAVWRDLVAAAGDRYTFNLAMGTPSFDLCGHWRDELVKLETNLQKLEEQCNTATNLDATTAVWTPRTTGDLVPPVVEHEGVLSAPVGRPLQIVARVSDPSGVKSIRLRYRHVTQYESYLTLEMQPTGKPNEYAATIPGEFLKPEWDAMYFIEAIDGAGNGTIWPDFRRESPYVFVKLQR